MSDWTPKKDPARALHRPARGTHRGTLARAGAIALAAMVTAGVATQASADPRAHVLESVVEVRLDRFELDKKLGTGGYDPVAYFPEGGGKPKKGKKKLAYTHLGVTYRFANEQNRERFIADPAKYEPAYGGWCAYAMAHDDYTEANPKRFTIKDGRLLLFYDGLFGDTYKSWFEEGPDLLEPKADARWASELVKASERLDEG